MKDPETSVQEKVIQILRSCSEGQVTLYVFVLCDIITLITREKGRDLTQSYDKNPYTHRKIQKATWQHKNATKNFDYTTIADRLRTFQVKRPNE